MWRAWFPWPNQCRAAWVLHSNLSQNWWSNCWFLGWTHGEGGGTRDIDERRLHSTNCLLEGTRRNRNSGNLEGTPWSGSTATLGLFDQVIGDIWWSREMSDEDHEDSNLFLKTSHWHREKQHNPTCKYREIASGNTYCTMCHDWKLKSRFGAYLEPQPPVLSWLVWKDPIICTIVLCCVCVFNPRQHRTWLALRYNLADLQAQLIPSSDHTISQNPGKWSFSYAMATVAKSLSLTVITVIIFMIFHDHLSFHSPVVVFFMCATDISQD